MWSDDQVKTDLTSILDGSFELEAAGTPAETREGAHDQAETVMEVLDEETDQPNIAQRLEQASAYAERLDATLDAYDKGHAFVNGKHFDLDGAFMKNLQAEIQVLTQYFQEKVRARCNFKYMRKSDLFI